MEKQPLQLDETNVRGDGLANAQARAPGSRERRAGAKWVFFALLALSAVFLVTEHRTHLFAYLPWLILLLCPLMHVFMHRGHGHGSHGQASHRLPGKGDGK